MSEHQTTDNEQELRDAAAGGLIDLGFLDSYAAMERIRRHAVERAALEPLSAITPASMPDAEQAPEPCSAALESAAPQANTGDTAVVEDADLRSETRAPVAATTEANSGPVAGSTADRGAERPVPPARKAAKLPARASRRQAADRPAPVRPSPRRESPVAARADRLPLRRDRREEIVEQLRLGPSSAQELAEMYAISREGVLRWLRLLEADGRIRSTAAARTSRTNRWVLVEDAASDSGAVAGEDAAEMSATGGVVPESDDD